MILALGLALIGADAVRAAPSGQPSWAARPNGEDVARAYPKEAAHRGEPGQAVIACRADARGRLPRCVPLAMTDAGFALAALKLGPIFRLRPKTSTGESVEGLIIVIPIRFTVDGSRSEELVHTLGSPAFLLRPGSGPGSIACGTSGVRESCTAHLLAWREEVALGESAAIVAPMVEKADSSLDCRVGAEGRLEGCALTGDFTPEERARLQPLIAKFRAPDATLDGHSTAGGRVVIPLPWRALGRVAADYLKFAGEAAGPP